MHEVVALRHVRRQREAQRLPVIVADGQCRHAQPLMTVKSLVTRLSRRGGVAYAARIA